MALSVKQDGVLAYILGSPAPPGIDFSQAESIPPFAHPDAPRRGDLANLRRAVRVGQLVVAGDPAPVWGRLRRARLVTLDNGIIEPTELGRHTCRANASCRDGSEGRYA